MMRSPALPSETSSWFVWLLLKGFARRVLD